MKQVRESGASPENCNVNQISLLVRIELHNLFVTSRLQFGFFLEGLDRIVQSSEKLTV